MRSEAKRPKAIAPSASMRYVCTEMLICFAFQEIPEGTFTHNKIPCYRVCDIGARYSDVEQFRGRAACIQKILTIL